ncbi:MAG: hypothetical protein Q8941_21530 [Bacteroidota bacterium]|nr:hypothetical protein [Bacteroidota bacterium]
MLIKDLPNGKLITFSNSLGSRSNLLNLFYFIFFFVSTLGFLYLFIISLEIVGAAVVAFLAVIAFAIASYRFGNKAFMIEKLLIEKNELVLITQGLSKIKNRIFQVSKISKFRHLKKPELTRHPLAGNSIDYLGFGTEQKVISEMHGDNRLAFDYEGKTITFGENVYSWDFETLEALLNEITGNDLTRELKLEDDL